MAREMIVVPYSEVWSELYRKEKELLESVFVELILDIQHFGSTSIRGMSAKPIIDIMIVVDNIDQVDHYNELMIEKGYTPKGENGIEGRRYFVKLSPDDSGNHTHHVHVYQKGNPHIADELMFRDYLGVDPESFKEYEKIKMEASSKYRYSPGEYVDAKSDCVMKIMEKARCYYAKGGEQVRFLDGKLGKLLDCFSCHLREVLDKNLVGIYLTGSIALNGYHDDKSDIDFTVVLDEALSKEQMPRIEALHRNLAGRFAKTIMEGQYVTVKDLGKLPDEIPPVITYYNGKIGKSYEGINAVTWFTLKKHGVTLWGKLANQLDFYFPEKQLLQYVQENVNTYWKRWLSNSAKLFSLRGIYGFTKPSVEWGVLGISRMYYTLREHDVVSKEDAGKYALEHVPERFQDILNTAVAIRTNCPVKQQMSWIKRRKRMLEFIEYLIAECNQVAISGR